MLAAWTRIADGEPKDDVAESLGFTPTKLRIELDKAGLPLKTAIEAWQEVIVDRLRPHLEQGISWQDAAQREAITEYDAKAALKALGYELKRTHQRVPPKVLDLAVQEVLKGGPDVNVTRIAKDHGIEAVSLNAAVRAELRRRGVELSAATAKRSSREEQIQAVREKMAEGMGMAEACRELNLPYATIAKAFSRERIVARLQDIKNQMVERGTSESALVDLGRRYAESKATLPPKDDEAHAKWLGRAYNAACRKLGYDPAEHAKAFGNWLSGRY